MTALKRLQIAGKVHSLPVNQTNETKVGKTKATPQNIASNW